MRFVPKALYSFAQYTSNALDTSVGVYTVVVSQFYPSVLFLVFFRIARVGKFTKKSLCARPDRLDHGI